LRAIVRGFAEDEGHVEGEHLHLAEGARAEEGNSSVIVYMDDRADVGSQPKNLAAEVVTNAGRTRAIDHSACGNLGDDNVLHPHLLEGGLGMLGVSDAMRVIWMGGPDRHVAKCVVDVAAIGDEACVTQELLTDLGIEMHRDRHSASSLTRAALSGALRNERTRS
jgi:hypothetical protein